MKKVEYLAQHTNDPKYSSVPMMLDELCDEFRSGERDAKKGLFISLDDADGLYHTRFCTSGLKCSEVVALLEYIKDDFIKIMKEEP